MFKAGLGERLGRGGLELRKAAVDPSLNVRTAPLAELDGLNEAFELVRVVRTDDFQTDPLPTFFGARRRPSGRSRPLGGSGGPNGNFSSSMKWPDLSSPRQG
ncbi:hypothetical protein [Streptomyces sp. JV176]|uniref:hypothetical protein n=1 Tax=Streptomyces sp. JV176 TaxID=858630 RepID=UPI002E799749|nr:hypothetical protein [Streptomyces sp. JV176]